MTSGEKSAGLDRKLDDSLEAYDASLQGEQQRQAARMGETAQIVGAREDAESSAGGSDSGSPSAEEQGGDAESPSSERKGGGSAVTAGTTGAPGPENLPEGHDDDVVARQLREAAENEEDPELKAKLWEEYRRYKEGGKPSAPAKDDSEKDAEDASGASAEEPPAKEGESGASDDPESSGQGPRA